MPRPCLKPQMAPHCHKTQSLSHEWIHALHFSPAIFFPPNTPNYAPTGFLYQVSRSYPQLQAYDPGLYPFCADLSSIPRFPVLNLPAWIAFLKWELLSFLNTGYVQTIRNPKERKWFRAEVPPPVHLSSFLDLSSAPQSSLCSITWFFQREIHKDKQRGCVCVMCVCVFTSFSKAGIHPIVCSIHFHPSASWISRHIYT